MAQIFHRPVRTHASDVTAVEDRPLFTALLGQILILGTSAALLLSGALTLARAGVDGDLSVPVVNVFGYTHTAWLGIGELVIGVLLLAAGLSPASRDLAIAVGVLMVVAAFVILADTTAMPRELAIQHSYGGFLMITGLVAAIGGLLPGGWTRRFGRHTEASTDDRAW